MGHHRIPEFTPDFFVKHTFALNRPVGVHNNNPPAVTEGAIIIIFFQGLFLLFLLGTQPVIRNKNLIQDTII